MHDDVGCDTAASEATRWEGGEIGGIDAVQVPRYGQDGVRAVSTVKKREGRALRWAQSSEAFFC